MPVSSHLVLAPLKGSLGDRDSLVVTQSFCQLMLLISLSAIPLYLGLFMVAVPFDVDAGVTRGLIMTLPVLSFVLAAMLYATGFLVITPSGTWQRLNSLVSVKQRVIRRKQKFIFLGTIPLVAGVVGGTLLLVKAHL